MEHTVVTAAENLFLKGCPSSGCFPVVGSFYACDHYTPADPIKGYKVRSSTNKYLEKSSRNPGAAWGSSYYDGDESDEGNW